MLADDAEHEQAAVKQTITVGSPVRVVGRVQLGFPPGKYKGVVSNAAPPSVVDELGFLRILLTKAPARWLIGKTLYVKPSRVVALPTKQGHRVPLPLR